MVFFFNFFQLFITFYNLFLKKVKKSKKSIFNNYWCTRCTLHISIPTNIKYKMSVYICKTNQFIGHGCRAHPFQACTPEHTEVWAALHQYLLKGCFLFSYHHYVKYSHAWSSPCSYPKPLSFNPAGDHISKKEPACTSTYYALLCLTGTHKAFVRKFSVRSVSQVNVLQ